MLWSFTVFQLCARLFPYIQYFYVNLSFYIFLKTIFSSKKQLLVDYVNGIISYTTRYIFI